MTPPQSLFNRPSAALLRMRREAKQQKLRAMAGKPVVKPLPIVHRTTATDTQTADRHEWLINEDWSLLQVCYSEQRFSNKTSVLLILTHFSYVPDICYRTASIILSSITNPCGFVSWLSHVSIYNQG